MVVPALPASPLAALVARVDAEAAEAAADGTSDRDASARHKALVRAAGRAALEETLNPTRQVADLSMESLTAELMAYAEVFGTNGMAAGGARVGGSPMADPLGEQTRRKEEYPWRYAAAGIAVAAAVGTVVVLAKHRSRTS